MESKPKNTENTELSPKKPWYRFIWNKYLIVTLLFAIWMFFFDQNSFFIHRELDKQVNELEHDKKIYQEKLQKETIQIHQIKTNPDAIEKIAREKHYLKKENEDVFIVEERKIKPLKTETHEPN